MHAPLAKYRAVHSQKLNILHINRELFNLKKYITFSLVVPSLTGTAISFFMCHVSLTGLIKSEMLCEQI